MSTVEVVAAVIVRDGLVYCVRRGLHGLLPGVWEFPGGKVQPGEDRTTALEREIQEELICRVIVGENITTTTHEYDFATIQLTTYYCRLRDLEPTLTEHASELWVPRHELSRLDWAPADVPAVHLIEQGSLDQDGSSSSW